MKIVMFFSYKGGVGRSSSLCNIASALCRKKYKVGIVDFDVDAPSLHLKFENNLPLDFYNNELTPDILTLLRRDNDEITPDFVNEATLLLKIPIANGECHLLPCLGRQDDLLSLENKWETKHTNLRNIFEMFGNNQKLDYLLVDSRSGFSQTMILVAMLCNSVVIVTRADNISAEGNCSILKIFDQAQKKSHLVLSLVPEKITRKNSRIKEFLQKIEYKDNFHVVPYIEDWYFGGEGSILWTKNDGDVRYLKIFDQLVSNL